MYQNNSCVFVGKAGKDAEVKFLNNGSNLCTISLAVYKSKEHTMWLNLSAFGSVAEQLMKAKKGDELKVYGEIWDRSWEKDGVKRTSYDLNVKGVEIKEKKQESAPTDTPNSSTNSSTENKEIPF